MLRLGGDVLVTGNDANRKDASACAEVLLPAAEQSALIKACRRQPAANTPVWLMRQAGRFMKEYREIRSRVGFLELCKTPEAAAAVTVMAVEKLGVDAAIIFSDLLLPLEPMGVGLVYSSSEGPVIEHPVRSVADLERLVPVVPAESLWCVAEAIKLTRAALPAGVPLIGFAGAPFTMASYLVEGGSSRHYAHTKSLMYSAPACWHALMQLLSEVTVSYLNMQRAAGAQVLQLFDSWVGCLSEADYREFVLPYSQAVIAGLPGDVPVIHFGTGTAHLLAAMREAGGDVIGLDWRVNLHDAWEMLGGSVAVQGNLDPCVLLSEPAEIRKQVVRILSEANGRPGHIFNLGHGILPETPFDHVKYLVETVHELGAAEVIVAHGA